MAAGQRGHAVQFGQQHGLWRRFDPLPASAIGTVGLAQPGRAGL